MRTKTVPAGFRKQHLFRERFVCVFRKGHPALASKLKDDGTITLERLADVIKVGRPAFGQENGKVMLFKLDGNGEAHRVHVVLGRSSVNEIEIVEGLQPGDQVILSDMSAQDAYDRIRLNQ